MIDGVNVPIPARAQQRLRHHHLLNWKSQGPNKVDEEGWDARWEGFIFTGGTERCTMMRGSFHKSSQGGTNWQNFTREQFTAEVERVCLALGLHDAELLLHGGSVEVGVNVEPSMPVADLLPCIVMQDAWRTEKGKAPGIPQRMREGTGITIDRTRYGYKIYDKVEDTRDKSGRIRDMAKARLWEIPDSVLRFEVVLQARELKRYGILSVADLCTQQAWEALSRYLMAKLDELLIVEPGLSARVSTEGLKPKEREVLARAHDAGYWMGLSRDQRGRRRKMLALLTEQHCPNGLRATLRRSIVEKLAELTDQIPATLVAMGYATPTQSSER